MLYYPENMLMFAGNSTKGLDLFIKTLLNLSNT